MLEVASPMLAPRLESYFALAGTAVSKGSATLGQREYGSHSISQAELLFSGIVDEYVAAYVPTPGSAGELADAGVANFLSPQWQEQIELATRRNGGLGDVENGFLAWSKKGFIRLRNPSLTPEQNRRMAEISLAMGVPVSALPARSAEDSFRHAKVDSWVNDFIFEYDEQLAEFLNNPSDGMRIRDGRRVYALELRDVEGIGKLAVSYHYRKKGGFGAAARSAFAAVSGIARFADPLSLLGMGLGHLAPKAAAYLDGLGAMLESPLAEIRRISGALSRSRLSLSELSRMALTESAKVLGRVPALRGLSTVFLRLAGSIQAKEVSSEQVFARD